MTEQLFDKAQWYVTGIVAFFIWAILAWAHYHGGVPSHHLLQRKDLPAISNWWGAILLPLIAWITMYRIGKRLMNKELNEQALKKAIRNIILGFSGSLLFGIILAVCFTMGYNDFQGYLVDSLLVLFFLAPIFRSEYLLGFVIGMTITFGAILPTAFALLVAAISAVVYNYIRPFVLRLIALTRGKSSKD
jgi:hypothetical protein